MYSHEKITGGASRYQTHVTNTQPRPVNLEPLQPRTLVNVGSCCQEKKELFPYWKTLSHCSMKYPSRVFPWSIPPHRFASARGARHARTLTPGTEPAPLSPRSLTRRRSRTGQGFIDHLRSLQRHGLGDEVGRAAIPQHRHDHRLQRRELRWGFVYRPFLFPDALGE
jgi:hypothetical protein